MNQKNLDYLKEGLKYLGFGEGLNDKLAENISKKPDQFQLKTENQYGNDKVNYVLDFKKGSESDMYFFNRYSATLKNETGEERTQSFYPKKNTGITAKEAYNLLGGRAVNKDLTNAEGQPYNAWLQLDPSQKEPNGNLRYKTIHEAYGYNLEKELQRHPIKELTDMTSKERLIQSLERGNLHQVTFVKGDKEEKMHVEANPLFKTLNIYDENRKKVFQENRKQPENNAEIRQAEPQKKTLRDDLKVDAGEPDEQKRKAGKSKGMKI